MNLEGIILFKTPLKERDVIANVLLRSGKTLRVYFYGGRGGGKAQKGSILEVGNLISFTLRTGKSTQLKIAKESKLKWKPEMVPKKSRLFIYCFFFAKLLERLLKKLMKN